MEVCLHFHEAIIHFQIYTVYLSLDSIIPNQKDSWGSRLFLLSKAITFHLLKDSTPQLLSQGQRRYISRSKCTIWKMMALLMCFVFLSQKWFSIIRVNLGSIQNLTHSDWYVCTSHQNRGPSLRTRHLGSESLFMRSRWGVTNSFCQFKAKCWKQHVFLVV